MPSTRPAFTRRFTPRATALAAAFVAISATHAQTAPEQSLSEVRVQASQDHATEGTSAYNAQSPTTIGSGLSLTWRETPQSISVVTRQRMEDFGLQSVEDIAGATTGLYLSKGSTERAGFASRGFSISNYALDGVPLSLQTYTNDTIGQSTLAIYDRVELLRGASGLLTGTGNPSGVINLVRKRPTDQFRASVEASVGSWQSKRVELDAGGPVNAAGTFRVRTVAALEDSDTFVSNYENQRGLLYAIAEAEIARATKLSFGGYYNKEKNPGSSWYGLPYNVDGSPMDIPRSFTSSPDWDFWSKENLQAFAELEHRFEGGWKAKVTALHFNSKLDSLVHAYERIGTTENFSISLANKFLYDHKHNGLDAIASGPFSLFGRTHELVLGAGWSHRTEDNDGYRSPYPLTYNPVTWDPSSAPYPSAPFSYYWGQANEIKRSNLFAATRLSVTGALTAIVGARLDWYDYAAVNPVNGARTGYKVDNEFTPYAGLVYDLDRRHSLYASVTSVFNPQSALDRNGQLLDPVTGTNLEAGIKGEYLGGTLNASAAVFQIRQKNLARSLDPSECNGQPSCSEAAGEVKSQGFELEATGAVTPAWNVQAGLSYAKAEYSKSTNANTPVGTPFGTTLPQKMLRLSTTYRLSGPLQGWRVGASLQSQSEISSTNTTTRVTRRHGGVTTVGLMAGWAVNKNLDLRLNISNLFDKYYYQSVGGFGEPRKVKLTAKYSF